jgi:outer membrane receptor protein involved in Fe transport
VLFFASFTIGTTRAQNDTKYIFKGVLRDSIKGIPLAYANLGLLKTADSTFVQGTTTDLDGSFSLPKVPAGKYLLKISYIGYAPGLIIISAEGTQSVINLGVIMAQQKTNELGGVEVSATKPIYQYAADKKVYNVSQDLSVQNGVATDALQNAPGVWVDMEGNITLRGVANVSIWINDKPSKLDPSALKEYLKQLPANALDRIEVITNPGAKYSASGTGGIINVVTRQKISKNWFLSVGGTYNTLPSYTPWISFVLTDKKFKVNVYANYSKSSWDYTSNSESTVTNGLDSLYSDISQSWYKANNSWAYGYLDLGYEFTTKDELDLWFGGSESWNHSAWEDHNTRHDYQIGQFFNMDTRSDDKGDGYSAYGGLTYTHKFNEKGHKLTMDAYGWQYESNSATNYGKIFSTDVFRDKLRLTDNLTTAKSGILYMAYTYPINDSTSFEAGLNGSVDGGLSQSPTDTSSYPMHGYTYASYLSNNNTTGGRNFDAYASFGSKLWSIDYKIGLRGEYRFNHMNSIAASSNFNREFFNVYPSVFLSYTTKSYHNITASYSRRVVYPNYQLDPFIQYYDEDGTSGGNPNLRPSYTNSFELGYSKYFKSGGSFGLSVYHRFTGKDINTLTNVVYDSYLSRYTLYSTFVNVGQNAFTGAELTLYLQPTKFLNLTLSGNAFYNKIAADFGTYKINREEMSWDGKFSATFYFLKTCQFQLVSNYRSRNLTLQGSTDPLYFVNAALRTDFFKRKLSVSLGMQDIFNWQKQVTVTNLPGYSGTSSIKNISRFTTLGVTLRFGKIEMENQVETGKSTGPKSN